MEKVKRTVFNHYQSIQCMDSSFVVIYVGLKGSQNYGLQDKFSDIDTMALVLPRQT